MAVTFIVCAAGEGKRFQQLSDVSKPFLKLNNKTLLEISLESLEVDSDSQVILIHRFSSAEMEYFKRNIATKFVYKIEDLQLESVTRGQAETAYLCKHMVVNDSIAIFNVDTYFNSPETYKGIRENSWDGIVPCFYQEEGSWSYFKVKNENGSLIAEDCAEKRPISNLASVGFYYFKKGSDFFAEVELELSKPILGEIYVAPIYKSLIQNNKRVLVPVCRDAKPMGTPEQLEKFWSVNLQQFKQEN